MDRYVEDCGGFWEGNVKLGLIESDSALGG